MLEAKVLAEGCVKDLTRNSHKLPALGTDICPLATRPDLVVVRHIDVEDQLPLNRLDVADRPVLLRANRHDRTNVYLKRVAHANLLLQVLLRLEGQVPQIDVIGQREGKLPMREYGAFSCEGSRKE